MTNPIRLFFATDIHGSTRCFKKFLNAGKYYNADVLILGGDITGKTMIPIVTAKSGSASAYRNGKIVKLGSFSEIEEFERDVENGGSYFCRCTFEEREQLEHAASARDALFNSLIEARMREWVALADQRLRNSNVRVFFNAGNDDIFSIDPIIDSSKVLVRPEGKCVEISDSCTMIATGFANKTPFDCPRDVPEEVLTAKIDQMVALVPDFARCIFNFHCPPFDSQLDSALAIDAEFRPRMTALGIDCTPVGSTAVRTAIEQYQPVLGLHGHIHESRGATQIGRTLCLNPGSDYQDGVLHGACVDLNDNSVVRYTFITG